MQKETNLESFKETIKHDASLDLQDIIRRYGGSEKMSWAQELDEITAGRKPNPLDHEATFGSQDTINTLAA